MTNTSNLISTIVERLKSVAGIETIVLGGSRARGTHTSTSDIDLGIYYSPSTPMDLKALAQVAAEIDDEHRDNLINSPGGWGPWINGGGWLTVNQIPVDFLYRDLDKVSRIITDNCAGRFEIAYQPGHPHAFPSYIYLCEVALCQPLWDPNNTLAHLKDRVRPYPPQLKQAIVNNFWWEADFSLKNAHKSISRGDVAYAAGCCFRGVMCLMQVLFALNEQYWMNEKGAVGIASGFQLSPKQLNERVARAFTQLNASAEGINTAIETLEELREECSQWITQ
jgi:predicted nucleotidyltransferase